MTGRALRLYFIGVAAVAHRLRHDLGRELAVAISSLVLFATFLYVFNDFLNVQVAGLSAAMRGRFAQAITALVLGLAAAGAAAGLRRARHGRQTLQRFATSLGEAPGTVRAYAAARDVTATIIWHAAAWYLVRRYLLQPSGTVFSLAEAAMVGATVAAAAWPMRHADHAGSTHAPVRVAPSALRALVGWRLGQIIGRNRLTRLSLLLACLFLGIVGLAAARGAPLFVSAAATLAAGYLAAAALVFQVAEDLPHAWVERSFGVTHEQFLVTYERLGAILGVGIGALALAAHLAGHALAQTATVAGTDAAKLLVLGALPAVLVPQVMLQIDGRRAAINLLLTLIAALFLGTAVLANWLGLLLLPLVRYYARQTQKGRFYRA